jgi:hypothetical protein
LPGFSLEGIQKPVLGFTALPLPHVAPGGHETHFPPLIVSSLGGLQRHSVKDLALVPSVTALSGHCVQAVEEGTANFPESQSVHLDCPEIGVNLPPSQLAQDVDPGTMLNLPFAQLRQAETSEAVPYLPASQRRHVVLPVPVVMVPNAQPWHVSAPT